MPSYDDISSTIAHGIGTFLIDLLSIIGLGLGGSQAAAAGEIIQLQQDALAIDAKRVLSPQELAAAVLKGQVSQADAENDARKSGIDATNFQGLISIQGNPPGPMQLLDLLNRGVIGEDDTRKGLQESYLRNEWISVLMDLRRTLIPIAELVAAVVQDQLDAGDAAARAAQLGMNGDDFDVMVRTAGNPPGPTQLLTMFQRNIISKDELDQGLRESRLKNKWIPQFEELVRHRIPMRTITTLLTHGAIDAATARQMLIELGFTPEDADALIASASAVKSKTNHDLSVAQVRQLYEAQLLSFDEAVTHLMAAGYTQADASEILQLADALADKKIQNQAVTAIRTRFVGRKISVNEASQALDGIGIPAAQRDRMLAVWGFEREANVAHLTVAQWSKLQKTGAIDLQRWSDEMTALGYSGEDVQFLAIVEGLVPAPGGNASGG